MELVGKYLLFCGAHAKGSSSTRYIPILETRFKNMKSLDYLGKSGRLHELIQENSLGFYCSCDGSIL
jgi:hypothetical protein